MNGYITQQDHEAFLRVIEVLVENAKSGAAPREVAFRGSAGEIVATLQVHADLPKRPKDMPRAMRPKRKLSKRQRDAAKQAKVLGRQRVAA